jgi:alpha-tubulin suppressor-like RCC1 family protein
MMFSKVTTFVARSTTIIALCLGAGVLGCSADDGTRSGGETEPTVSVDLALTSVPATTQCIRISATPASGAATVKNYPVTAGASSSSLQIGPFSPGSYTFAGDAFNVACANIGSNVGTWIADPVPVTLRPGAATSVTLTFRKNSPVTVSASFLNNALGLAVGNSNSFAVTDAGVLQAGLLNGSQAFTRMSFSAFDSSSTPGNAVVALAATYNGACAVRADGTIWCWGTNYYGELGPGISLNSTAATPVQVAGLTGATQISASLHTCAIANGSNGKGVYCWGSNNNGQLGINNTTDSQTPVSSLAYIPVKSVTCGGYATYAVDTHGSVYAWGYNGYGQIGDGTTTDRLVGVMVQGEGPVATVAAGGMHACSLRVDGTVRCWGYNAYGTLGNGTTDNSSTPVQITGLVAQKIVSGSLFTCAITDVGQTVCWGINNGGQMGDRTNTARLVPTPPALGSIALTSVASSAFSGSACGIASSFDVYCWGNNGSGQLGDGTTNNQFSPVKALLQ